MMDGPTGEDPDVTARAAECIQRKQSDDTDERARFVSEMLGPLGPPLELEHIARHTDERGITTHRYHVTFKSGKVIFDFGLFPDGKINQSAFRPLPGEPSPLGALVLEPDAFRELTSPRPGETPEAAQARAMGDLLSAYRKRIEAAEAG